jgi:hypothetical protein
MFRTPKTGNGTYWALVKTGFTDENGKRVTGQFDIQVKRNTRSAMRDLSERHKDDDLPDIGILLECVVGWRGVIVEAREGEEPFEVGEDGGTKFSQPALEKLIDDGFGLSMIYAINEALPGAKAKN